MKKGLIVLTILVTFMLAPIVRADTIINIQYGGDNTKSELWYLNNLSWNSWRDDENIAHECTSRENCYNQAIEYYNETGKDYYSIWINISPRSNEIKMDISTFNFSQNETMQQTVYSGGGGNITRYRFYKDENGENKNTAIVLDGYSDPNYNNFYMHYDTNYNFVNDGEYIFRGFYDNEGEQDYNNMLQVRTGGNVPKIIDLIRYNSWSDYEQEQIEGYTEVNLDDYEYVLLSLKDYSQTKAFQTNLQVKGQIGITPIYNYGQTSKDDITGVKVQDRCNVSYADYTTYPFYVIQSDLQNNVIYAVKSCSNGSSFKFDNTIFNVTYVTQENVDQPTITINGKTYNVIPYDELPSTATENEEENYIPGESGNANDTGGLDNAIKNAQQKMSEIWNTITYFTDFINQIFSSLPTEIRTILVSAFTIMITIGLIKIFVS